MLFDKKKHKTSTSTINMFSNIPLILLTLNWLRVNFSLFDFNGPTMPLISFLVVNKSFAYFVGDADRGSSKRLTPLEGI